MKAISINQSSFSARATTRDETATHYRALHDPLVEIVVPVLNEEHVLRRSIEQLDAYMAQQLPWRYRITIADNGSQDGTAKVAAELAHERMSVQLVQLDERGRGRALRQVWLASDADIVSYIDVDLSTSLDDFRPLLQPLITGEAGVAIGSRLAPGSRTTRGVKREIISRCYNRIIKWTSGTTFRDAQCGFKALRRDVAQEWLPQITDNEWFFDTELLIKTERAGVPIHQQPVTWVEDTDSRVNIIKTAVDDLKGLYRVHRELRSQSLLRRWSLPLLLVATGALYAYGALHNGMANSYYAAAVQAASQDWTAWLFGSLDAANYVSVDKPPLATMVMGLSARLFGFSSFSMLLPSVLAGVGSVWLLYAAVKRQFGFKSAIIAASVLALTPAAVLMFGFNNPDAILTFLLTASAYTFLRSLEGRPLLWLGLAAGFTGLAFHTKMLQGLMVLPAMVIVYALCANAPLIKRLGHLIYAGSITLIATFWWSLLVWVTPASQRPWVGSTQDNSIWSLIFGYNGFGRLLGNGPGGGMGSMGAGFGGQTGVLRMFNSDFGPNIAWLLLAAIIGGGLLLWLVRRAPRTHRGRAATLFWLLWLVVHMAIFSITSGTIHSYYVVVMAPAIAALVGMSAPFVWAVYRRRHHHALVLPLIVLAQAVVAVILLHGTALSWLAWLVGIAGFGGAVILLINLYIPQAAYAAGGAALSAIAMVAAPVAYSLATVNVAHNGSLPTAGPSSMSQPSNNENGQASSALTRYLLANQGDATWIVATSSANESAPIQLSTGRPVMAVGGFNGSDTPLTLEQFQELVRTGKVRYYAMSGHGLRGGGPGGNNDIAQWVAQTGTKVIYGGNDVELYQLSV